MKLPSSVTASPIVASMANTGLKMLEDPKTLTGDIFLGGIAKSEEATPAERAFAGAIHKYSNALQENGLRGKALVACHTALEALKAGVPGAFGPIVSDIAAKTLTPVTEGAIYEHGLVEPAFRLAESLRESTSPGEAGVGEFVNLAHRLVNEGIWNNYYRFQLGYQVSRSALEAASDLSHDKAEGIAKFGNQLYPLHRPNLTYNPNLPLSNDLITYSPEMAQFGRRMLTVIDASSQPETPINLMAKATLAQHPASPMLCGDAYVSVTDTFKSMAFATKVV